jgi:phosphoglycerol transferase MdoB-like AlkP superfamily enzyme
MDHFFSNARFRFNISNITVVLLFLLIFRYSLIKLKYILCPFFFEHQHIFISKSSFPKKKKGSHTLPYPLRCNHALLNLSSYISGHSCGS